MSKRETLTSANNSVRRRKLNKAGCTYQDLEALILKALIKASKKTKNKYRGDLPIGHI